MGIADLWPILCTEDDERVAFPVFLTHFLEEHGRFPRLALDAYMFMFWSQLPGAENDPNIHRRILRNFMAKLWYLVQHNVLFVVVFDGKYKPGKLRNGHIPDIPGLISYDETLRYFRKLLPSTYSESLSLVDQLKLILQRNCMDYVQAPGEAEAECAWLQKLGVVDFVVSDDSDTFVFGASQVLRLFNRVKYKNENGEDVLSSTDYYVNPVYMDKIIERTGLDKDRLVLVAVLRGGDYNTGAVNVGITRASEIALCGSTMLSASPRKAMQDFGAMPDFTRMFTETFVEMEKRHVVLTDPYYALKPEMDRSDSLAAFNEYLALFLRLNAKRVFGRMANMKGNLAVDDYYALLYFFPLVNSKVFKFTPYLTSFSSLSADSQDLWRVTVNCAVSRFNHVCDFGDIGLLTIQDNIHTFDGKGRGRELTRETFALPNERKYNLKSFALKLLTRYPDQIKLARAKMLDGVSIAVLKFQRQQLNEASYLKKIEKDESQEDPSEAADAADPNAMVADTEEDDDTISVFVTMAAVQKLAPKIVEEFEKQKVKKSPRKKLSPQKTTLDQIWVGLLPKKSERKEETTKDENLNGSPTNVKREGRTDFPKFLARRDESPSRNSPRRRRKNVVLPGQSMVTSFFQPQGVDPFQDVIHVISDEEDVKSTDYMSMRNVMASGPKLSVFPDLQPVKQESGTNFVENIAGESKLEFKSDFKLSSKSRVSSPELSPSKKIRRDLTFSPDNSPTKFKTEHTGEYPPA